MKRCIEALVVIPMLLVIVAMAILGLCGIARADPAQQVAVQVPGSLPAHLEAPGPRPVVTIAAQVSPRERPIPRGTSLTMRMSTSFESVPAGGDFVLQRAEYRFGHGARLNGRLFPSCSAAKLRAGHGRLSVCPPGSKVGTGVATGRAVAVGVTSSGRLTIFNGPGGRSLIFNIAVTSPALVNATFEAPIVWSRGGRYAFTISTSVPPELQRILDGDVVVTRIDLVVGANRTIDGRRRGYLEATACPRSGAAAIHGEFEFNQGMRAVADRTVAC